jgi:site-specific DNA-methyltransferase (adenine-specific)
MDDIELWLGDCLLEMRKIPNKSVDMILADLPYGSTNCAWDTPIDLCELWKQYKRIIKPYHAIVMFSAQPFTSILGASNIQWLKYSWIWEKNRSTGHVHSKNKPMKKHEDVLVFSEGNTLHLGQSEKRMPYYPQGLIEMEGGTKRRTRHDAGDEAVMGKRKSHKETLWTHTGYPTTILHFDIEMNEKRFHETQKPIDLCEYLIKTYSLEGELVLDNVMGSGSSGVACKNTNRRFLGIEKDVNYFDIAENRIFNP